MMIIWKTHRAALSGAYHPWMNGVFVQRGAVPSVAPAAIEGLTFSGDVFRGATFSGDVFQ